MDEIILLIGLIITFAIIGLYSTNSSTYASISLSSYMLNLMRSSNSIVVYLTLFFGVLIANASIIIFIPYPLLIIYAIEAGKNPLLVIIISSLGAASGEMSSYILGKFGRKVTQKHKQFYEKISRILNENRRKIYFLIFLFALTPLPDDLILVPLGLAEFGFLGSFIPCFLGKLILIVIIALLSDTLVRAGGPQQLILDLLTIWIMIGMIIFARRDNEEKFEQTARLLLDH